VPYLGIANLLLKEPMYPEYIQGAATPAVLAAELDTCLGKIERLIATQTQADKLRALLRDPSGGTVADWVLRKMA
jgi:lipid-A-disaccharide synthase